LERLVSGPPLLLDAAMGSDLDRRGVRTSLPLWSALGILDAPDVVRQIHLENLLAGADVVTTNTFRTTTRTLGKAGLEPGLAPTLDARAVHLAREARAEAGRPGALIAGSIAPLEDCYLPTFDTPVDLAYDEHRAQARNLTEGGVDFLMVETMPTIEEAVIALRAALSTGIPATVGFVCEDHADDGAPVRLRSGELLAEAARAVERHGPAAILVNCAPAPVITAALREMRRYTDRPIGGYANAGHVDDEVGWSSAGGMSGEEYAEAARPWLELGARIVGGCCGTNPIHTEALRQTIDRLAP
jgi:S-methylmethionine-dependent homocysteine/selenocysteine methylase